MNGQSSWENTGWTRCTQKLIDDTWSNVKFKMQLRTWLRLALKFCKYPCEPRHDKNNKMTGRLAKTQISLGIRPVWPESSLCAQWVAKDPSFLHADSDDTDQTGRMPRLIWVFAGRTVTLLVLSCCGSCIQLFQKWDSKPVFGVCDQIRLKPACSGTETI